MEKQKRESIYTMNCRDVHNLHIQINVRHGGKSPPFKYHEIHLNFARKPKIHRKTACEFDFGLVSIKLKWKNSNLRRIYE